MELIQATSNSRTYEYSTYEDAQSFGDYMLKAGCTTWDIDSQTRTITIELDFPVYTVKIGRFRIARHGGKVSISPGKLMFKSTYCRCTTYDFGNDLKKARHQALYLCRWARNETRTNLWDRLNHAPHAVYVRFQHMVARRMGGKWLRGIAINAGVVQYYFE